MKKDILKKEYQIVVRDASRGLAKPFVKSAKKVKVFSSNTVDSLPGIVKKEYTLMNNKFSNGVALTGRKISSLARGSVYVASTVLLAVVGGAVPSRYRKKIIDVYNSKFDSDLTAVDAADANSFFNFFTYSVIGASSAFLVSQSVDVINYGVFGLLAAGVEVLARETVQNIFGYAPGSVLGNVVSLPVLAGEGVYKLGKGVYKLGKWTYTLGEGVYELGASINRSRKDYLSGVKARANKELLLEQKNDYLPNNTEEHFDSIDDKI